ncbi:MAG: membrane dipeptidase [Bacteroidota bacterium]
MSLPLIIDGHLDLSMNAMEWNRDLRATVPQIRARERGMTDKPDRGLSTVSLPALREGNIGICFATLIARYAKPTHPLGGWNSPEQAWGMVQAQLAWYEEMIRQGEMKLLLSRQDLDAHLTEWNSGNKRTIGFLLTLEGADSILSPDHLQLLYERGLRAIGPAHYGPGTYAYGTDSEGSIGAKGRALLKQMSALGIALDATHLCDTSFWEALDIFQGVIWASHSNCRTLVDHNRQFSDQQIKALISRGSVIGMPLDAWMMVPNWVRGKSHPNNTPVSLNQLIDNVDHICQLVGSTEYVALGTDLDGGFGKEQCPTEIDTIADLQQLKELLTKRGYSEEDVTAIFSKNWLRKLREVLE